jgi:plastocyanin
MLALRLVAAVVALCTIGSCGYDAPTSTPTTPPAPSPNTATDITIPQNASQTGQFTPNPKVVALGGAANVTIRWVNRDYSTDDYQATAVVHNIVSQSNPVAFSPSGNLNGNSTYSIQLSAPGDYPYECTIHPNMQGTIHVDP